MRTYWLPLIVTLTISGGSIAQPISENPARDIWETVFARDGKGRDQQIGYSHIRIEPLTRDGKTIIRGTRELRISFKRDGQLALMKADTGTEETADGKVAGVFMKHWTGEKQVLDMKAQVNKSGKAIDIKVNSSSQKYELSNPWDSRVIGVSGEANLFRDKKVKTGDSFGYRFFEPTINYVVTVKVEIKDVEEVLLPRGGKKKLLRAESNPEKIRLESTPGNVQEIQMPPSTLWLDPATLEPLVSRSDFPGIGLLTFLRSTKAMATAVLGDVPDLMKLQSIPLPMPVQGNIHELRGVVYIIKVNGKDVDAAKLIKEDDRQSIENLKGQTFELHVVARPTPRRIEKEKPAADEFLQSNHFINSKDENVKKLAAKAVGNLTDPWDEAKAIERWVRANMKPVNYAEALATSDHVAKTLSGDCTEYSMLAAAMCRAQKIPSRTAIGLVYVRKADKAELAFHMWTEVYIKGQWLGLDATLGQGAIGPGHIKITDHSWHDVLDFKPLLPVTGFLMAKPTIEIKEATFEPKK